MASSSHSSHSSSTQEQEKTQEKKKKRRRRRRRQRPKTGSLTDILRFSWEQARGRHSWRGGGDAADLAGRTPYYQYDRTADDGGGGGDGTGLVPSLGHEKDPFLLEGGLQDPSVSYDAGAHKELRDAAATERRKARAAEKETSAGTVAFFCRGATGGATGGGATGGGGGDRKSRAHAHFVAFLRLCVCFGIAQVSERVS